MTIEEINKRYSELKEQGKLVREFLNYGEELYLKSMVDFNVFDNAVFNKSLRAQQSDLCQKNDGFLEKWTEYKNRKKEVLDEYAAKKIGFYNQLLEFGFSDDVACKIAGITYANGKKAVAVEKD